MSYKKSVNSAETEQASDGRQMCAAHGCPNRWSTESSKLCRWHSASAAHHWPTITREQQEAETERARANTGEAPPPPVMLSFAEKRAILERMRKGFGQGDPRAWVARLQARQDAGERLSTFQFDCLRNAKREPRQKDAGPVDLGSARQQAARKVERYMRDHPEGY